jgi:hypothetical protein
MELIPVFSLIVLVATFGTFIMAIGAYVMFRYKERRGRASGPQVAPAYEADVIAPEPVDIPQPAPPSRMSPRRTFSPDDTLAQYTAEGYVPVKDKTAEERRQWR